MRWAIAVGLVACAGCGAGDDATAIDARDPDATPIDGGPGPFALTVYSLAAPFTGDPTTPLAGAEVFLVAPDGSTQRAVTDAAGHATATIAPGTTAFALRAVPETSDAHLTIAIGLEPGGALTIGTPPVAFFDPAPIGNLQLSGPVIAGANFYQVASPCIQPGASFEPFFFVPIVPCARLTDAPVAMWAADVETNVLGYAFSQGLDLSAPRVVATVTNQRPPATAITAFASVPAEVEGIQVVRTTVREGLTIPVRSNLLAPSASTLVVTQGIAPLGERTLVRTRITSEGAAGDVWNLRRAPGDARHVVIDLGAAMLPFMTTPSVSLPLGTVAWTNVGGGGRRPDVVVVRATYQNAARTVELTVIGPGAGTHLTWPAWPAELAPAEPDVFSFPSVADFYGIDVVGRGFADLLPTIDADARGLQQRDDVFRDDAEVWFAGVGTL